MNEVDECRFPVTVFVTTSATDEVIATKSRKQEFTAKCFSGALGHLQEYETIFGQIENIFITFVFLLTTALRWCKLKWLYLANFQSHD